MVRKEPRFVLPNLHVEWFPRYLQGEDGVWRIQSFKLKRTVRHKVGRVLLDDLRETCVDAARVVEEREIRRAVDPQPPTVGNTTIDDLLRQMRSLTWVDGRMVDELQEGRRQDLEHERVIREARELDRQLRRHTRVAYRAHRRLPAEWRARIGMDAERASGVHWPTLRDLAGVAVENESTHWIRAPFEFGRPGPDGLRSRIVEQRVDDLAGLLEEHGSQLEFWMVQDAVGGDPRWVLPAPIAQTVL
jgi:hypothetical protein